MSPQRIQRRRTKGWRMPEGAVYVGRPSKWGNPWRVVALGDTADVIGPRDLPRPRFDRINRSRGTGAPYWATRRYENDLTGGHLASITVADVVRELAGRDLVCWCPLEDADGNRVPCHADVLLEIANSEPSA